MMDLRQLSLDRIVETVFRNESLLLRLCRIVDIKALYCGSTASNFWASMSTPNVEALQQWWQVERLCAHQQRPAWRKIRVMLLANGGAEYDSARSQQ